MKLGKHKNFFVFFIFIFLNNLFAFGADKIESVPLINLEELSPTFEEGKDTSDIVAYIQVKDLSAKDNNRVFLFNGWTFASSPTLQSIDHPIYDLWITSCENI